MSLFRCVLMVLQVWRGKKPKDLLRYFMTMKMGPSEVFIACLHQEALCAPICGQQLGEVMPLVIQVVNFMVA